MHEYEEMRRREEQERLIREEMVQEMKQNREEKLKTSKSLVSNLSTLCVKVSRLFFMIYCFTEKSIKRYSC